MKRKYLLALGIALAVVVTVVMIMSKSKPEVSNDKEENTDHTTVSKPSESYEIVHLEEMKNEVEDWSLYNISNADVKGEIQEGTEGVVVSVNQTGASEDDIQLIYNEALKLTSGRYEIKLPIKTTAERSVRLVLEKNDEGREALYDQVIKLKDGEKTIQLPVEIEEEVTATFSLRLGQFTGEEDLSHHTIEISDFTLDKIKSADNSSEAEEPASLLFVNVIKNPEIKEDLEYWGNYNMLEGEATLSVEDEALKVHITNNGTKGYSVQVYQDGIKLYTGNKYKMSFKYKGNTARKFEARIQKNGGDYKAYVVNSQITFGPEWQTYEQEFVMEDPSDVASRFQFNVGVAGDATRVHEVIYFDDFELVMTEGDVPLPEKENPIRVNQVGYRNGDAKVAFVVDDERTYKVFSDDNKLVLTGNLNLKTKDIAGKPLKDTSSGDVVREADFSGLKADGNYYIKVREEKSPTFAIRENVYDDLTKAMLKFFYYQRCGGDGIDAVYVGEKFAHEACHTGSAVYYDGNDPVYGKLEVDVSGGWHDAGDYGRYITPAAKAVADLLLTAEHFPEMSQLDFGSEGLLLEETRYEIEWMLKMQNPETGGVYHKVTTIGHAGMTVLPEDDNDQLYLSPVSPQAAGDFAATMAYAGRMYNETDAKFAEKCLAAAEKAWAWLEANKDANTYEDPSVFHTGPYGDASATDERYWAAAELYKTTGDEKYHDYILNNELPNAGFGWADMGSYALVAYLTTDSVDKNSELYLQMKERFVDDANNLINIWANDGYNVALDHYVWGSNKDLSDRTMILIIANQLQPNEEYEEAIMDQLHYLLGRNAMNTSYVTDFGENAAKNPHHRQSATLGEVVPGMLVGGPNGKIMEVAGEPVSLMVTAYTPPARCYADIVGSYATNEITIYWNSPAVYILGYLNSQEK